MKRPLGPSVSRRDIPLYNLYYLHAPRANQVDATILWGTELELAGLQQYLRHRNATSPVLIAKSHVLVKATATALVQHPELNRRVVGRHIYEYRNVNVRMAYLNSLTRQVDVMLIENAHRLSVQDIASIVWHTLLENARGQSAISRDRRRLHRLPAPLFHALLRVYGWLDRLLPLPALGRLEHLRSAAVLVNDLSFHNAPPMCSYKPTRFPDESALLNVTLGPATDRPVAFGNKVVVRAVAPLLVRADHRLTDAYGLARFTATLRDHLSNPGSLEQSAGGQDQAPIAQTPEADCPAAA